MKSATVTKIVQFPSDRGIRQPIAQFIRIGDTGHKQLADLHATGNLPAKRVVVDASRLRYQRELVDAFQRSGAEIVLDTKSAELAAIAKVAGYARHAPWATENQSILGPDAFSPTSSTHTIDHIAQYAVEQSVNAVLAPTHYLGDKRFGNWLSVDCEACSALRIALDSAGGKHIAIDYSLILPRLWLNDPGKRGDIMARLADLPFDNLWIRSSVLDQSAGPLVQRQFLTSLMGMHNLGKPIVLDYIDGLVGAAALAFGACSGIAHGIGERGRFDANQWHVPPREREENSSFGQAKRIAIPGLDRSLTIKELRALVSAQGARSLIVCNNRQCCPSGLEDMIRDPRKHAANQSLSMLDELSRIPDSKRAEHLVANQVADTVMLAQRVKKLKPKRSVSEQLEVDTTSLMKRLDKHCHNKETIHQALEKLIDDFGESTSRSKTVVLRQRQEFDQSEQGDSA